MTKNYSGKVLLVGSVPLDSVEEVLRCSAREIGPWVSSLPDGEVGERRNWVYTVAQDAFDGHPDLETHKVSLSHLGTDEIKEDEQRVWHFRVRDGVESIKFDGLRFAEAAADSYRIFCRLRDEGVISSGVRFQVALPTTPAVVIPFFRETGDWPMVSDAYRAAIKSEIEKLLAVIPADDLVVQWDICVEVMDLLTGDEPLYPWSPKGVSLEQKWRNHISDMAVLSTDIPEEVQLGYHFCFGTSRGWPNTTAPDMQVCVRMSNSAVEVAGRRVDYVHIPVMPNADEGFFAPLQDLNIGDTSVILGLVVHDSIAEFERRAEAASRYLPDYGIASYCGWGREDPAKVPQHLRDLRECAEKLFR